MIPSMAEKKYNIADRTSQTSEEKLRPPCRSNSGTRRERKKERERERERERKRESECGHKCQGITALAY